MFTHCRFTLVNSVTELLLVSRSSSFALTVAVLEMLPEVTVNPVNVSVALALLASEPKLQIIVPSRRCLVTVPWLTTMSESFISRGGNKSVNVTPVAAAGPRLMTVTMYVTGLPRITGSGLSKIATARSASFIRLTAVVAVARLFVKSGSVESKDLTVTRFVSTPPTTFGIRASVALKQTSGWLVLKY